MNPEPAARIKILIIDDDPMQREITRDIFLDDPYDFIEAGDGRDGIQKASEHQPRLIIVDMRMPKMTGLEFVKTARQQPDISHIPIVISTASSAGGTGQDCLEAGAVGYFEKPVNRAAFRIKIRQFLGLSAA